jgi:hypothetical protein
MFYYFEYQPSSKTVSSEEELNHFFPQTSEGFLTPKVEDVSQLSMLNQDILNIIAIEYEKIWADNLLSLFFLGSPVVHTKKMRFDTVAVVSDTVRLDYAKALATVNSHLLPKYSFIHYFNSSFFTIHNINNARYLQFIIKVLAIRVYGLDIETHYADFKANREIIFLLNNLDAKMLEIKNLIRAGTYGKVDKGMLCNHAVKYLLRCAFELVIEKEKRYTREPLLCQQLFAKYYPQHEIISKEIFSCYNSNHVDEDNFIKLIYEFASVLRQEYRKFCQV